MRSIRRLIVSVLLVTALSVSAQDDATKCCCTTYDTSVCLLKIHEKIDAELNDIYQKALSSTGNESKDTNNLKDAERKWITYRDAACKAEYELWGGGSGGPNARMMCTIRLTKLRIADLKETYLKER
jgi:uncharacterized protein YecT (DUF1311 family)